MSDQDYGKKLVEGWDLEYFLEAYEIVTNQQLSCDQDESPDFICHRENGDRVGLELTQAPGDSNEIIDVINEVLDKKNWDPDWKSKTILVIQFMRFSLDSSIPMVLDGLQSEFADHNWQEIWLADYTGHDAFGNIEIYGLHPEKWWGYHQRPNWNQKPYG